MAEKCFPLENTMYTAEDAQMWFATRTSGVYAGTHLPVTAAGTMDLSVGTGIAWLHYDMFAGCVYGNTDIRTLTVEMSDAQYDRIDRVCVRLEMLNNLCYLYIKKGASANSPVPPALQRDNVAYEISVAQIYVGVGVTGINAGDITDERLDEEVCGLMSDGVTGIDTSVMHAQVSGLIQKTKDDLNGFEADFEAWFDTIKGLLEGDVAAKLAGEVAALKIDLNNKIIGAKVQIPTDGWSGEGPYTQSIPVEKASSNTDSCHVIMSFDPVYKAQFNDAVVSVEGQMDGALLFSVEAIPESPFLVNVLLAFQGVTE